MLPWAYNYCGYLQCSIYRDLICQDWAIHQQFRNVLGNVWQVSMPGPASWRPPPPPTTTVESSNYTRSVKELLDIRLQFRWYSEL